MVDWKQSFPFCSDRSSRICNRIEPDKKQFWSYCSCESRCSKRHGHRTHKFSVDRWTWLPELHRIHAPRQTTVGEGPKTKPREPNTGPPWMLMGPVWFHKAPGSQPVLPGSSARSGYRGMLTVGSIFWKPKRNQTGPGTRPLDRTTTTGPKTRLGLGFKLPVLHFIIFLFFNSFSFSFSNIF
jgi:hypothetical protein